jgi:hypothetical protein
MVGSSVHRPDRAGRASRAPSFVLIANATGHGPA